MNKALAPGSRERKSLDDSLDHCRASLGSLDKIDFAIVLSIAAVAAIIFLPGLGRESLANWDEAIYGVITRNLVSRPGLTLYYAGQPWFEKPPFLFWLMAASSSLFGVTEFALRLPVSLFGISAVALQYLAARRLSGRLAGILAAIFLLGVPQFVAYSRLAMTDVPLTALGMSTFVLLLYGDKRKWPVMLAAISFGLAILVKSAAAFLFVPGLVAIALASRGVRFFRSKEMLWAAALSLVIALPWHLWTTLSYGSSFLGPYFFSQVLRRFGQPLEGHEGDFFFYFDLYLHNAGWLALVHAAGIALACIIALRRRDARLAALVTLPLGAFLIVSLQRTKIGWYLTPVYPGAALAAALAIVNLLRHVRDRVIAVLFATLLAVPGIVDGRGAFVEMYNIVDFSPEVRSLRDTPLFVNRVPLLYVFDVGDPSPRFYLADRVEIIDQQGLERLVANRQTFLCLTFRAQADEFLNNHTDANLKIVATTDYLAVIEYR
ncbi:MAG TPA: glycosyltransferase family 39 protein [Candidatus Binatia bacterium]